MAAVKRRDTTARDAEGVLGGRCRDATHCAGPALGATQSELETQPGLVIPSPVRPRRPPCTCVHGYIGLAHHSEACLCRCWRTAYYLLLCDPYQQDEFHFPELD